MIRHPARNRLIILMSVKAVLRAEEIARLNWWMTNDSQGEIGRDMCFQDSASRRRTFTTNAALKISTVGGSLRDVQMLAGHYGTVHRSKPGRAGDDC